MDRLASEGVRFETTVTNFPVCMAARSILISGQYNRSCTGGVGNVSYPDRPGDFNMPEYPYAGALPGLWGVFSLALFFFVPSFVERHHLWTLLLMDEVMTDTPSSRSFNSSTSLWGRHRVSRGGTGPCPPKLCRELCRELCRLPPPALNTQPAPLARLASCLLFH